MGEEEKRRKMKAMVSRKTDALVMSEETESIGGITGNLNVAVCWPIMADGVVGVECKQCENGPT